MRVCVRVFSYYSLFLGHKATLLPVSSLWELQCSQPTSQTRKAAVFRKCKGTLWTLFPRISHAEWNSHTNNNHLPMFLNTLARLFTWRAVQLSKSRHWLSQITQHHSFEGNTSKSGAVRHLLWVEAKRKEKEQVLTS